MEESKRTPTVQQLQEELSRERRLVRRRRRRRVLLAVLLLLALVLAVCFLRLPVLRISGDSMANTLLDGDIAVGLPVSRCRNGDVILFRYQTGVLVKRLLAQSGDYVEFDGDGRFFVNGARLDEPYIESYSRGNCDVVFPLTVPDGALFVAGDNRPVSIDSRSSVIGCVEASALEGRLLLRVWPLSRFGLIR